MNRRCKTLGFCEDYAHEMFITGIFERFNLRIEIRNSTGGSRVWNSLGRFIENIKKGIEDMPDILVVVIDGDCNKYTEVRDRISYLIESKNVNIPCLVVAIPEPHIERWYIEDQQAIQNAIGKVNYIKPKYKCERHYYKNILRELIRSANVDSPLLGGVEYGKEIAKNLNPNMMDNSFKSFWQDLRSALKTCCGLEI